MILHNLILHCATTDSRHGNRSVQFKITSLLDDDRTSDILYHTFIRLCVCLRISKRSIFRRNITSNVPNHDVQEGQERERVEIVARDGTVGIEQRR